MKISNIGLKGIPAKLVMSAILVASTSGCISIDARTFHMTSQEERPTPSPTATASPTPAPSPTPTASQVPVAGGLLQKSNIVYEGAFRVPNNTFGSGHLSFGGGVLAFNETRNSLFIANRESHVAEISIPEITQAATIEGLKVATPIQNFAHPLESGSYYEIGGDPSVGAGLYGMLPYGNRLIGAAAIYYDASASQRVSHFVRPKDFSLLGEVRSWFTLTAPQTGFVSGWMAHIPTEWQSALGGKALAGQCCIPIVSRSSYGFSAFAFNPEDLIAGINPVQTNAMVYYTGTNPLDDPNAQSDLWNTTATVGGLVFPKGSSTVLYIGKMGIGEYCYGIGTGDPTPGVDEWGHQMCYDPAYSSKSQHAYPYVYKMWAYDAADFAAVKAGTKKPWELRPYSHWTFELPHDLIQKNMGGVTYDPSTQRIFVAAGKREGEYSALPVIHVFKVK